MSFVRGGDSRSDSEGFQPSSPKKRRIPKACASCRTSKLRCDGGKPCARCREKKTWCDYIQPVRSENDAIAEKLAWLEAEISSLREARVNSTHNMRSPNMNANTSTANTAMMLLQMQSRTPISIPTYPAVNHFPTSQQSPTHNPYELAENYIGQPSSTLSPPSDPQTFFPNNHVQVQSHNQTTSFASLPLQHPTPHSSEGISESMTKKRKRDEFELNIDSPGDLVSRGVISIDDAEVYFRTFFEGCDRYVPVFDPKYDTFGSVRSRSTMLFDVICVVGCKVQQGPNISAQTFLNQNTKSPLCTVLLGTAPKSIETIQALLIDSCYSEKGWMMTSMALKMALELDLPGSYRRLSRIVVSGDEIVVRTKSEEQESLMRESRVWFGVWVLEHLLSVDCGKTPGIRAVSGEVVRRCRVLLRHPAHTTLDFRLLAQVELNAIRAQAHERLLPHFISRQGQELSDEEMSEIVQGTRIDLSVWLSDWRNLVERHIQSPEEKASLIVNLNIQRDWAEMTMLCKGLQGMGIENVAMMSGSQRNLISQAKNSAKRHLATILSQPDVYLATFKYSMDFVWAKCAFSVLLLLKIARIVPSSSPQSEMTSLISNSKTLLSLLAKIKGSGNIYLRILALSVEKCEKALNSDGLSAASSGVQRNEQAADADGVDPETDFQSYVPREFTLEWNFPGLNFCWIPCDWMDLFADFGARF